MSPKNCPRGREWSGKMLPMEIEDRSMEIIESELQVELAEDIKPIVKRVIHATADFSFAETMRFTPGIVELIQSMLENGATVVTDTNMALAGINKASLNKLGAKALCFVADEDVAREAKARGVTRSFVSMERALKIDGPKLLVCGNAPTFLLSLLEIAGQSGVPADTAVIGVPVGFVNVVEAKEKLWASGIPCIAAMGRRGGSNVAAAIVNALMYGIRGVRS
ncbi:MAG: precorrin-8X methylmutase [Clostridiales bacterium]|nr:precorrin-8X methylmutase [Clostridiales bacterium]